jgi:hypothetical protein
MPTAQNSQNLARGAANGAVSVSGQAKPSKPLSLSLSSIFFGFAAIFRNRCDRIVTAKT